MSYFITTLTQSKSAQERRSAYLRALAVDAYTHMVTIKPSNTYGYDRLRHVFRDTINIFNRRLFGPRYRERSSRDLISAIGVIEDVGCWNGHLHLLVELPDDVDAAKLDRAREFIERAAPSSDVQIGEIVDVDKSINYLAKRLYDDADDRAICSTIDLYGGRP